MRRRPRPTVGLSPGERRCFWRMMAACCLDEPGFDEYTDSRLDVEEHLRFVAQTVARFRANPAPRKVAV